MQVEIVQFPKTPVAAIEHHGPPAEEHETLRKLVAWKLENGLLDPDKHRHYGVNCTDPRTTADQDHHVDFCLSLDEPIAVKGDDITIRWLSAARCALARNLGSRSDNQAARYLFTTWLPASGEQAGELPCFFHYVNVGPAIPVTEMITDVYLPLR